MERKLERWVVLWKERKPGGIMERELKQVLEKWASQWGEIEPGGIMERKLGKMLEKVRGCGA